MTTATKQNTNNDIDWGSIDGSNQDFTDVYPRIQWMHGKRQMKQLGGMAFTGGLFIPADQFPNFQAEGWAEASFIASSNEEIPGYYSPKAHLAIIRVKKFWDDKGSHVHAICAVKGIDGIFSLQVGGISKALAFERLFTAHRTQIVALANRSKPDGAKGLEPFALWCVINPDEHSTQANKNDSSKSSEVTRPILFTPDEVNIEYVRSLWVGTENYKTFAGYYKETEAWQNQIPVAVTPETNGVNTLADEKLKRIIDLAGVKNYDLRELALTVTNGSTTKIDLIYDKEADDALELLKSY